jgi:hypothetical protein
MFIFRRQKDYDRANPITKQEALQEWLRKLEMKKRNKGKSLKGTIYYFFL